MWTSTSSKLWGTTGNWSTGVPTNVKTATFNGSIGLQTSITLLASSTTGSLSFLSTAGANAYTFDTLATENTDTLTIASGITNSDTAALTFYNTTTLGGTQTWTDNGGAMNFNGQVNLGSGASGHALTVNGTGAVAIAGVIANGGSAAGSLIHAGSSTLTLSGANTFTGSTTINSGTVSISADDNLGTAPASATAGMLNFSGGTLNATATFTLSGNRGITLNAGGGTFDVALGTALTVGGVISGTGALTSADKGTLILAGANTYTGVTTVDSGASLQLGNGTTNGTLATASGIAVAGTLILDESSAVTIAGVISGTGGLTKNGSANTTLSGANSYSGSTVINAGTLTAGSTSAFGDGTGLSDVTLNNSGTLALNNFNNTVGSIASGSTSSTISLGSATLTAGGDNTSTSFAGVISGTGGLTQTGTGTLTLLGVSTFTGATTINSGASVSMGNGAANGGVVGNIVNNGTLILDENAAGPGTNNISGTGTLIQNAAIDTTLSGSDTYSGATTVNSGTLTAGTTSAFGGATGLSAVTVNGSGTLGLGSFSNTVGSIASASSTSAVTLGSGTLTTGGNNSSTTFAGTISGTGGILTKVGAGTMTLTGANTYTGATNINAGALSIGADDNIGAAPATATTGQLTFNGGTLDTSASFSLSANRGMTLNAGGGTFVPSAATTLTYGGIIAGTGALTLAGPGNLALTGVNTYTGATHLNGGTLTIGADSALGTAPATATANQLSFTGGGLATTASFTLNANRGITVNAGGGTVSAGSGTTLTFGGLISGAGSLSFTGAGTVNLTSNSLNMTGGATVTSGELEFSGTLPSIGTLTLGSGSTLFLNASTLSVGNLVISGNSIIDFAGAASELNVTNLTIGAGDTLTVLGWTNEVDYFLTKNWTGVTLGSRGVGPESQVSFSGSPSGSTGWLAFDNEVSPAPEPSTYGAILVGISLLGIEALRRKRLAA